MIRVLLVDESPVSLAALRQGLSEQGDLEIVASAGETRSAMDLIGKLRPQVVCSGLELSRAIELTRAVMREIPTPILLLISEALDSELARQARAAGALEILAKPSPHDAGAPIGEVSSALRVLAGVKVFSRRAAAVSAPRSSAPRLVAIGASTGGPQALCRLLKRLDDGFPLPILCVQHMTRGFLEGMVGWLATQTRLGVKIAVDGEKPRPGQVYFAPEGYHLRVRMGGTLAIEAGEPVDGHRPSATVLFESVAESFGSGAIGVLLTGMGVDGAHGLLEMSRVGALTMAQDEESSVVFGMPRQAVEIGAVKKLHSLDEIGARLGALAQRRGS